MARNLLSSLFKFRPELDRTSSENFLTEAFSHALESDPSALQKWLSFVLQDDECELSSVEVSTRESCEFPNGDSVLYPDMIVRACLTSGERIVLYCEHKWDAPCSDLPPEGRALPFIEAVKFLTPLCPNCHRVLHSKRGGGTFNMDELKKETGGPTGKRSS